MGITRYIILFAALLASPVSAVGFNAFPRCDLDYALLFKDGKGRQDLFLTFFANANPQGLGKSQRLDNRSYLKHLEKGFQPDVLYLHLSLKVMKQLNDRVYAGEGAAGKEGVNAVRNLFRIILSEHLRENPNLWKALMHQYVDFKSMEFPFDKTKMENPAQFERELAGAVRDAQIEFESVMFRFFNGNQEAMQALLRENGIVSDYRAWHTFGIAEGHPDLAATAARFAPSRFNRELSTPLNPVRFSEKEAAKRVEALEGHRASLAAELGETPVMTAYEKGGPLVLSHGAIDLLRKVEAGSQAEYLKWVKSEFKKVMKVDLSTSQALALRDYFTQTDFFQPNIRGEVRTEIRLAGGAHGVQSVDFANQNVFNFFHTMGALAKAHKEGQAGKPMGQQAVLNARAFESRATDRLTDLKTRYDRTRKENGIEGEYQLSGDDGVIVPQKPVTRESQQALYRSLMAQGGVADFRMVTISPSKEAAYRGDASRISADIVKGETLEKAIRKSLKGELPPEVLAEVAFPVHINPDTGAMEVFVVGAVSPTVLTRLEKHVQGFPPPAGSKISRVTVVSGP